jgi:hypothetical protein
LRASGYTAEVVERWLPWANVRRDFLQCIDILAIRRGEPGVLGVQATSGSNLSARLAKAKGKPGLRVWLAAGNRFECWGWQRRNGRWTVRLVEVKGEDLTGVLVEAPPSRRRRRGERQQELFR